MRFAGYRIVAVGVMGALAAAAAFLGLKVWLEQGKAHAETRTEPQLALQAQVDGKTLHVVWDHNAAVLRTASNGTLTIRDGSLVRNIALNSNELRSRDAISYSPKTNEVELRLEISGA